LSSNRNSKQKTRFRYFYGSSSFRQRRCFRHQFFSLFFNNSQKVSKK
jgi:hypothetical protein